MPILEFNRRVLAQARRADVPLLERLRYICIVSSNLDEFFEVRFADYIEAARRPGAGVSTRDLEAVAADAHALIDDQYAVFNDEVMPALAARRHRHPQPRRAQRGAAPLGRPVLPAARCGRCWCRSGSIRRTRSRRSPTSRSTSSRGSPARDAFGRENTIAIVKVPRVLPRVIRAARRRWRRRQAGLRAADERDPRPPRRAFPGREVEAFSQFRVTRDSDLEVDEHDVTNLRQALRSGLTTRHFGQAIRLEVVNTCPPELSQFLLQQFELPAAALYRVNGPVNLVRLNQLIDQADAPALRFPPYEPAWPQGRLPRGAVDVRAAARGDVLLHHPFESFEPVVQFLREAVHDPDVLAIKQTIYRTGSESPLMDLLIEAARRGKEVMAVVELKARFDEEANINWAERLEAVGAQVVYGIVGLKTHAKLLLVTRREARRPAPLCAPVDRQLQPEDRARCTPTSATSPPTPTSRPTPTACSSSSRACGIKAPRQLLHRAVHAARQMLRHVALVEQAAREGKPARIVLKMNALTDVPLIAGARRAPAQAGADDRPDRARRLHAAAGVPGVTERIRVRSVVGRFLEHSRVLYFRWGAERRRRGAVPVERRLDGPQHVPPHRGRLAGATTRRCASASSTNAWCRTCTTGDAWVQQMAARPARCTDGRKGAEAISAQQALMQRYVG